MVSDVLVSVGMVGMVEEVVQKKKGVSEERKEKEDKKGRE